METQIQKKTLIIDLSVRLPDINNYSNLDPSFQDYGRIAIDRNDNITVMGIRSSHPSNTTMGFYWAISDNVLYISPRGSTYNWESYITEEFVSGL